MNGNERDSRVSKAFEQNEELLCGKPVAMGHEKSVPIVQQKQLQKREKEKQGRIREREKCNGPKKR